MKLNKKSEIIKLFNILKKRIPLKSLIKMRRIVLIDDGWCCPPDNRKEPIEIIIDSRLPISNQVETLIHEYAHAIVIDKHLKNKAYEEIDKGHHNGNWGKAYARCYRIMLKYYLGQSN